MDKKRVDPWEIESQKKWIDPKNISSKVLEIRKKGLSIATLNGSFDLMHAGHLHILFEASKQADILILALNSDESIRLYKSHKRPIIPLKARLQMASSLFFVDYVTWFDETDPRALLEKIRPDVHVNGAEYGENCLESETVKSFGGKVHIVPLVPALSTSSIIAKIQSELVSQ